MWHEPDHRTALLELIQTGKLTRRSAQAAAWQELLVLGWARRTARATELTLVPAFRTKIEQTLDRCWPGWRLVQAELLGRSLPPTPAGLHLLDDQHRAARSGELPHRMNQRTAAAVLAVHSKARLGAAARSRIASSTVTTDYVIRLRGCGGLCLHRDGAKYDAAELERVQGELILSERALLDGTTLVGQPRAVLLVENLGPFVDFPPPADWLLVHAPGWATQGARKLLSMFPDTPALHFGDLDPEGLEIYCHLREVRPDLIWVVPDWLMDYVPTHGQPVVWPRLPALDSAPPLIQKLAQEGVWLEQEALVLDERLRPWLEQRAETERERIAVARSQ